MRCRSPRTPLALLCLGPLLLSLCGCQRPNAPTATTRERDARPQPSVTPAAQPPELYVYEDEAMLRKPYAIIGGTVRNITGERLEDLSVELELKRRADGSKEFRAVKVEPEDLAPGQEGKYSLKILSDEWSGSKILQLRSGTRPDALSYKSLPGARRPPERLPERVTRVVKEARARSQGKGEEFINTPDTPVRVP